MLFLPLKGFFRKHPLAVSSLIDQPVVYHNQNFFVFGGYPSTDIIGCLDAHTYEWSLAGRLQARRYCHRVIHNGNSFVVVGGRDTQTINERRPLMTESCNYANDTTGNFTIECTEQRPNLYDYTLWPELCLVSDGFCEI